MGPPPLTAERIAKNRGKKGNQDDGEIWGGASKYFVHGCACMLDFKLLTFKFAVPYCPY